MISVKRNASRHDNSLEYSLAVRALIRFYFLSGNKFADAARWDLATVNALTNDMAAFTANREKLNGWICFY